MAKGFEHHARNVSILTVGSRITGLVRDAALARVFGLGPAADAFNFAFMIPNLFRRLFGEGALSSAFLPAYAKSLTQDGQAQASALAWRILSRAALILGGFTLFGELILGILASFETRTDSSLVLTLMAIMLPYMPLVCLVALMGAILNVHHRFGPTACAPVILNLGIAGSAVAAWWHTDGSAGPSQIIWVACAVVIAGLLQVGWSALALRPMNAVSRVGSTAAAPQAKQVWKTTIPMVFGLGVLQVNVFIDGLIASWPTAVGPTILGIAYPLAEGSMTTLSLSQRLYEFPLGVFGIAVSTAIFPQLAREAAHPENFLDTLRRGLRVSIFIGLAASVGLLLVRFPLAMVLYQGGEFTNEDAKRVAWVVLGYSPAIWSFSINQLFTKAFYALGETRTPVRISLAMVGLNFLLNVGLIWTPLGLAGLAWSTSVCAILQSYLLSRALSRRTGSIVSRDVQHSVLRSAIVVVAMAIAVIIVGHFLPVTNWTSALWTLVIQTTVGALVVMACARILRMDELRWALGRR